MVYFTLSNFYFNFSINNFFIKTVKNNPDWLKFPVAFVAATGNFPYSYWNGGYNNNQGKGAFYEDFIQCSEQSYLPLRFNCSNIFLDNEDFDNTMMNLILLLNENGSNSIELNNIELYNYLKEKYPNYKYVFSKEAELLLGEQYTSELINFLLNENIFKLISLPEEKSLDLEFLKNINDLKKIELSVNTVCDKNCFNYKKCQEKEHFSQYNFGCNNIYQECKKHSLYHERKPIISIEDIKNIYYPMGVRYFRIADMINDSENNLIVFLIDYFIKDEFKEKFYKEFLLELERIKN